MEDDGLLSDEVREAIERAMSASFAWSWVVAYRSALVHAKRDRLRYRVFRQPDDRSPTGWRWTWEAGKQPDYPCPKCGSESESQPDCPSYHRTYGGCMRCNPATSCGDAAMWSCTRKRCGWSYAVGYNWANPNNARLLDDQGARPDWISA